MTGLEGLYNNFLRLRDTPSVYTSQAGKFIKVISWSSVGDDNPPYTISGTNVDFINGIYYASGWTVDTTHGYDIISITTEEPAVTDNAVFMGANF